MKKYLGLFLLCLLPFNIDAQILNNSQERKMNLDVLELIGKYELNSRLSNKTTRYNFTKLFSSPETPVFCDLYNNGKGRYKQIPVSDYIDFCTTQCESITVQISNVRKLGLKYKGQSWYYTVAFDKLISYNDVNGVLFPPDIEYGAEPMQMEMTVKFDLNGQNPKIDEISISDEIPTLQKRRYIIVQKSQDKRTLKKESQVTVGGYPLRYNSFEQAHVFSYDFQHPDEDVLVLYDYSHKEDTYDLIYLKFKARRMRLKLRNEIAPMMYSLNEKPNGTKVSSFGYSLGFDIGGTFSIASRTKGGIFVGAALSFSSLNPKLRVDDYTLEFSDSQGRMCKRVYNMSSVSQKVSFRDFVFPAYLNIETEVSPGLKIVADLGAKAYINSSYVVHNAKASARITHTVSGSQTSKKNEVITFPGSAHSGRSGCDFSLFFSAGTDIELVPTRLFLEAKLGYERGIKTNSIEVPGNNSIIGSSVPALYSGELDKDFLTGTVINGISYARNAIWISVGLNYKF